MAVVSSATRAATIRPPPGSLARPVAVAGRATGRSDAVSDDTSTSRPSRRWTSRKSSVSPPAVARRTSRGATTLTVASAPEADGSTATDCLTKQADRPCTSTAAAFVRRATARTERARGITTCLRGTRGERSSRIPASGRPTLGTRRDRVGAVARAARAPRHLAAVPAGAVRRHAAGGHAAACPGVGRREIGGGRLRNGRPRLGFEAVPPARGAARPRACVRACGSTARRSSPCPARTTSASSPPPAASGRRASSRASRAPR